MPPRQWCVGQRTRSHHGAPVILLPFTTSPLPAVLTSSASSKPQLSASKQPASSSSATCLHARRRRASVSSGADRKRKRRRRKISGRCSSSDSEYAATSSADDEEEEEDEGDDATGSEGDDSNDGSGDDADAVDGGGSDDERGEQEDGEEEGDMDCAVSREKLKDKKEKAIVASISQRLPVSTGIPNPIARRTRSRYRNASKPILQPSMNKAVYILLDSDDEKHAGTSLEESSGGTDLCNSLVSPKAVSMEEEKVRPMDFFPSASDEKSVSEGKEASIDKKKDCEPHGHALELENGSREAEVAPLHMQKEKALPLGDLATVSAGAVKAATSDQRNLRRKKEKSLQLDELVTVSAGGIMATTLDRGKEVTNSDANNKAVTSDGEKKDVALDEKSFVSLDVKKSISLDDCEVHFRENNDPSFDQPRTSEFHCDVEKPVLLYESSNMEIKESNGEVPDGCVMKPTEEKLVSMKEQTASQDGINKENVIVLNDSDSEDGKGISYCESPPQLSSYNQGSHEHINGPFSSCGKSTSKLMVLHSNCIARRTRSNLAYDTEFKPVDYKVFFQDVRDSDEEKNTSSPETSQSDEDSEVEMSIKKNGEPPLHPIVCANPKQPNTSKNESGINVMHTLSKNGLHASEEDGDDGSHSGSNRMDQADKLNHSCPAPKSKDSEQQENPIENVKLSTNEGTVVSDTDSDYRSSTPSNESDVDFVEEKPAASKKAGTNRIDVDMAWNSAINMFNKTRSKHAFKDESLYNMFVNSIWNKDQSHLGEHIPSNSKDECIPGGLDLSKVDERLPLLFSFGDDDPKPPEKTEYETAMDDLWAEYDFALRSVEIGCYHAEKKESENINAMEREDPYSIPCTEENHCFILDEEVGIICKFCSLVTLEMRYILPSFAVGSGGIYGSANFGDKENISILGDLCTKGKSGGLDGLNNLSRGTVWDLIPGVKSTMYPHQQEGFEFIWRNLGGSIFLDKLKEPFQADTIGGCVISHAPGTGKSRLAIVFLQSFMKVFPECRPVLLAPRGMLLMWEKEFKKWGVNIPFHLLNGDDYNGEEDKTALHLVQSKRRTPRWMRIVKLFSWNKSSSILGVSYGLFEKLVGQGFKHHTENDYISNILTDRPGLFIFDEGHTPRNERSNIWKVLEKIKAERRIILSGTPFQNNFGELYNTLCLVRPKFAEKISVRSKFNEKILDPSEKDFLLERDERRGKWVSLTSTINDASIEELKSMISPFVHVHNGGILKSLPGLRECLVFLEPLPKQKGIVEIVNQISSENIFGLEYKISLTSIHPSLLLHCALSEKEESLIDKNLLERLRLDPYEGVKTKFVVELIRLSESLNEKVLIFSQYIEPLALVKDQLISIFNWMDGREILQMDGKIRVKHRQASIDLFNRSTSKVRVLLASTRACCEGISLTGASRVVLLDVVWNPSVENQAISRAYRLGQQKVVYTYHLIASGTREVNKYDKQTQKERLSKLVFSSENVCSKVQDTPDICEDKVLEEMMQHEKLKDMFKMVLYQPKHSNLTDAFGRHDNSELVDFHRPCT